MMNKSWAISTVQESVGPRPGVGQEAHHMELRQMRLSPQILARSFDVRS